MTDEGPGVGELAPLVGTWRVTAEFADGALPAMEGTTTFEWLQGRRYLLQRATTDHPAAPDVHAVIAPDRDRPGSYLQHYFDSRGVVRLYAMTFDGRTWTLTRTAPDFSPLDFSQRFTGSFSDGADTLAGRWERSGNGADWQLDFRLVHHRA